MKTLQVGSHHPFTEVMMQATLDLESMIADGLDNDNVSGLEPSNAPLFSAPVLTAAELETLIAAALDAEFGV